MNTTGFYYFLMEVTSAHRKNTTGQQEDEQIKEFQIQSKAIQSLVLDLSSVNIRMSWLAKWQ